MVRVAFFFLLFCFLVTACGKGVEVDADIRPLFDVYMDAAPNDGRLNQIDRIEYGDPGLGDDGRPLQGICSGRTQNVGTVALRKLRTVIVARQDQDKPYYNAMVVFHELGHCIHGKQHTKTPGDIMFEGGYEGDREESEAYWREHLETKLTEMFRGDKSEKTPDYMQ